MKKLQSLLLYTGAAALLAFSSCKKDEDKKDDETTIADVKIESFTVTPSGITSFPTGEGIVIHTKLSGTAENNLKSVKMSGTITYMGTPIVIDTLIALTGTSFEQYDTIEFDMHDASYSFSITVNGATGNSSSMSTATFYTNSIKKSNVFIGNQADSKAKFWSAKHDSLYFLSDLKGNGALQADMDFAYITRTTANGGNKLIAPSSDDATDIYSNQWSASDEKITTWDPANRRNTGFIRVNTKVTISAMNSDNDTDSLIQVAKQVGEPSNPFVSVTSGDIYLFRTVRGTVAHPVYFYGLIYVANATGSVVGTTAQPGDATLIIRYQKEK